MSWCNFTKRKCINCGYEFNQSNDTLSLNTNKYNKCPKCLSDSISIENKPLTIEDYYKNKRSI